MSLTKKIRGFYIPLPTRMVSVAGTAVWLPPQAIPEAGDGA